MQRPKKSWTGHLKGLQVQNSTLWRSKKCSSVLSWHDFPPARNLRKFPFDWSSKSHFLGNGDVITASLSKSKPALPSCATSLSVPQDIIWFVPISFTTEEADKGRLIEAIDAFSCWQWTSILIWKAWYIWKHFYVIPVQQFSLTANDDVIWL